MANSTIGVRLEPDIKQRLENLGKLKDRSPHYLMKKAIEKFIEREEAIENERELQRTRWERFQLTGEAVNHEDVISWADSLPTADDHLR